MFAEILRSDSKGSRSHLGLKFQTNQSPNASARLQTRPFERGAQDFQTKLQAGSKSTKQKRLIVRLALLSKTDPDAKHAVAGLSKTAQHFQGASAKLAR